MSNIKLNILEMNELETSNLILGDWTITLSGDSSSLLFAKSNVNQFEIAAAIVSGCTDNAYVEYNASADVDDGSCATLKVNGCTNASANNYNASANTDDGSCILTSDSFTLRYNNMNFATVNGNPTLKSGFETAVKNDVSAQSGLNASDITIMSLAAGSIIVKFRVNYLQSNSAVLTTITNLINNNNLQTTNVNTFATNNSSVKTDSNQAITMSSYVVAGCTDSTAINYNSGANTENNTCVSAPTIITNEATSGSITVSMGAGSAYDFSSTGTHKLKYFLDNDSTTLQTALSKVFNVSVTGSNSSVTVKILDNNDNLYLYVRRLNFTKSGCTQPTANNYNQYANTDDGTCAGCTDATAINYDNTVAVSDKTCVFTPSRHTTENQIIVTVPHQEGMVFGTEESQKNLQMHTQ